MANTDREAERSAISTPGPPNSTISCLCVEIQRECGASTVLGYLPDPDPLKERRFCLSHVPNANPKLIQPIQLKSLLTMQQQTQSHPVPPHLRLSAKQRYGLAAAVTWAVLHLSGTPWLSDSWDIEQLYVFCESTVTGAQLSSHNCSVSYLFETNAAPSKPTCSNRFQSNLIRNKTLFALGVLLIELSTNKPLEGFWPQDFAGSPVSTPADQFNAAESRLDDLYLEAGDSYAYAVQRCLRCEFPGRDVAKSFDFPIFRSHFYNTVVAPIQATYLRYPASCAAI